MSRTTITNISTIITLLALMAWALMPASTLAAPVTWTGTDGTNPTFWDIGTTANWDNGGATTYTDGDDVTFDDTGTGTTVDLQATVSPTSFAISTSANAYTFNSADVSGTTSIIKSGTTLATFAQGSTTFSGGTQINGSGDIQYDAVGAGPHSFGSGTIEFNNSGAEFIYNPAVASSVLTNNLEINAPIVWTKPLNSGTHSGTTTVNSDFTLNTSGSGQGLIETDLILTDDRQITGGRFGGNFSKISGDVTSSGGPHDFTARHIGQNPDWRYVIGDSLTTTPWAIQNFTRTSGGTSTQSSGTIQFDVDERDFFDLVESNGGQVTLEGSIEFLRSSTVEVDFNLIILENNSTNNANTVNIGTGFRNNDTLNIDSGGLLGGDGTMRSRVGLGAGPQEDQVDVNVLAGGEISPGDATQVDTTDILTIQGDLGFTGGTLSIDITGNGGVAGDDFDQLIVEDTVSGDSRGNVTGLSNATLNINFDGVDHDDLAGNVIDVLLSVNDLSSQSFGNVTRNAGIDFEIIYGNGFVRLQNFVQHVPEPNSLTLLALGMCVAGLRRRRRRNVLRHS